MANINTLEQAASLTAVLASYSDTESEENHFTFNEEVDLNDMLSSVLEEVEPARPAEIEKNAETSTDADFKQQIFHELAKINAKLDKLLLQNKSQTCSAPKTYLVDDIQFPINSPEDMCILDKKLEQADAKEQLIEKLSEIGGRNGNEIGNKVAYKLCCHMFATEMLIKYSWTGSTRQGTAEKIPFLKLQNVIQVIFQVVKNADRQFTVLATETFLKNKLLKHSQLRMRRQNEKASN